MTMASFSSVSSAHRITILTTRAVYQCNLAIRTKTTSTLASDPMEANLKTARPFKEMPGPKGIYNLPLIGFMFHLKPFGKHTTGSIHLLFDELMQQYGSIFRIQASEPSVVVGNADDLATVLQNEGKYPNRPSVEIFDIYNKRNNCKDDLSTSQGEDWLKVRMPLQKTAMKSKNIVHYIPNMNQVADEFVEKLSNGYLDNRNTEKTFMGYMAEGAGTVMFNTRLGFLDDRNEEQNQVLLQSTNDYFEVVFNTLMGSSFLYKFYRDKDYITYENARNLLTQKATDHVLNAYEVIKEKQRLGIFDEKEPNVLYSLIKENGLEQAIDSMHALFIAAIDSSAAVMQLIVHTMAKHPDKQERLRQEIHNTIGLDQPVTLKALNNMPYLKACITECYRCTNPIPLGAIRKLPVDVVLSGYKVPAGTQIYNYTQYTCRDPSVFPEPDKYFPERWLRTTEGSDKQNAARWSVLPFGAGIRSCVGRRLFEQEVQITLAKIVQKLRVGLKPESEKVKFEYKLFWKPLQNLQFTFSTVDNQNVQQHDFS